MIRKGIRTFAVFDEFGMFRDNEPREVDLDDKAALIPSGSVLLCENGHAAAFAENSMFSCAIPEAEDFAPLQVGMKFIHGNEMPRCRCGANLWRCTGEGFMELNIQGRGWVH